MEDRRSDLARGTGSSQGSGGRKSSAAARKGKKKNHTPCEGQQAAGTETTSTWTGEKKAKIQSTPTSGALDKIAWDYSEHSSSKNFHEQEQGPEQIEGLDWDKDKLDKEIDLYLGRLHGGNPDNCEEEFWDLYEGEQLIEQLTTLNERLALCRLRADENNRELDDASLAERFPPSVLELNVYYEWYEPRYEWYFYPEYCNYARLQDYQRLTLRDNGQYEDWEFYRKICSTLEGDQQFVQFWEELSRKTKLIELYLTASSCELPRIERLLFYHALKIAGGLPHFYKTIIYKGFAEFKWSVEFDNTWYNYYAGFYFDMWKLVAKQKMNFKEALKHVHEKGKYTFMSLAWKAEFEKDEPNLDLMEYYYKPYLDRVGEKLVGSRR